MGKDNNTTSDKFAELRKRAQEYMQINSNKTEAIPHIDAQNSMLELNTYQIELELQNNDLRDTQIQLEQSLQRYSNLYDFAPVGYLTISKKGLIDEANLTVAKMLGVARGNLIKIPFSTYVRKTDQNIYYLGRENLLSTREPQKIILHIKKNNGRLFHAQLEMVVDNYVDDSNGQFRLTITDITAQKKLEQELKQTKKWEQAFNSMNNIVTLMNKNLRIIRANKTAHDYFNVKPGKLIGKHCYELLNGSDKPCIQCPIKNKSNGDNIQFEEIIKHKILKKVFKASCSIIKDVNGETEHIVSIVKDITKQRKKDAILFQSDKMNAIGTLAGGIAHDFNNILAVIIGYSDLIKSELKDSNPLKHYIIQILKAGDKAKDIVTQILAFSRKKHGLKIESLEPYMIVSEVIKTLQLTLPTTIELKGEIAPKCSSILADMNQFHQVILNLCTNACQAIGDNQGTIIVKLSEKILGNNDIVGEMDVSAGKFLELVVQDTGKGISKEFIDHIFEPYYTTKKFGAGSGMGLAVVHGIVKSHGGIIKVTSEIGKGSTFSLYFPVIK